MTTGSEFAPVQDGVLESWDRGHFMHPSTHAAAHARGEIPTRLIDTSEGVYIIDSDGRRTLDGFSGLYCVNVGYGRTEIIDAIAAQARKLAYYHSYWGNSNEPAIRLVKMIVDRAPPGMSHVYYGLSGSDANETAIKLAWYYNNVLERPEKKKLISRWRSYHGSGVMTGSLTGLPLFHQAFDLPVSPVLHTDAPVYFSREDLSQTEQEFSRQCAENLETLILAEGPETVAAFVAEPMLGTGGIVPPPAGYWELIRPILRKYDVLLIADEVVTGFGRIGAMFGSELYALEPDIMTVAKGLTSAYLPLSAAVIADPVWQAIERGADRYGMMGHGWTYSAHALCAAAGIANLEIIDREGLVENARVTGAYLRSSLREELGDHPHLGDLRGEGMTAALEFVADRDSRTYFDKDVRFGFQVASNCFERGLIARPMPHADILGLAPPLTLTTEQAEEIVAIVAASVRDVGKRGTTTR